MEEKNLALLNMLSLDAIEVNVVVDNWIEAVRYSGKKLLECGAIEERFIDAMIKTVKELGPYIVIAPGLAIPHARPEDGALKPALAIITLKKPVNFGNPENDPVHIVIALAAVDKTSHVKALAQLAEFLQHEENIKKIREAKTKEDVYDAIRKFFKHS